MGPSGVEVVDRGGREGSGSASPSMRRLVMG